MPKVIDWITGPALETVKALDGIKPGDEVRVKIIGDWRGMSETELLSAAPLYEATNFLIMEELDELPGHYVGLFTPDPGGRWPPDWEIKREEIVAWRPKRRPHGKQHS